MGSSKGMKRAILRFAAKRLQIIAQGRKLSALGNLHPKYALKVASEALGWRQRIGTIEDSDGKAQKLPGTPSIAMVSPIPDSASAAS